MFREEKCKNLPGLDAFDPFARGNGVTPRITFRSDQPTQRVGMIEPKFFYVVRQAVGLDGFPQNLPPSGEVASHDRMFGMDLVKGAAMIFHWGTEKTRGELVFHFFDTRLVSVAEKKADHAIGEHTFDEGIDDGAKFCFAAQLLKWGHISEIVNGPEARYSRIAANWANATACPIEAGQLRTF